jgi:hypothetical protein
MGLPPKPDAWGMTPAVHGKLMRRCLPSALLYAACDAWHQVGPDTLYATQLYVKQCQALILGSGVVYLGGWVIDRLMNARAALHSPV